MSTDDNPTPREPNPSIAEWKQIVAQYEEPSVCRATWQIVDTLGPYFLSWVLMYRSLAVSW
jgi:omega-6 fatty acid desaturase (delta-12 desaturase)